MIGEGAMGVVYKAHDPAIDRIVAIKTIRREPGIGTQQWDEFRVRFAQEAKAAGRLEHPGIVRVYEVGDHRGTPYIVMEYVPGGSLKTLAGVAMDVPRAVAILTAILRALDHAHSHGVIHRDVKPANILLTGRDDTKLTDFGVAKIDGTQLTRTNIVVGTPCYMAPEIVLAEKADARADIYSAGIVLFELLAGRPAFSGDLHCVYRLKLDGKLPPVSSIRRGLPAWLDRIVATATATVPADRFQKASAFVDALSSAQGGADATGAASASSTRQPRSAASQGSPKVSGPSASMPAADVAAARPAKLSLRRLALLAATGIAAAALFGGFWVGLQPDGYGRQALQTLVAPGGAGVTDQDGGGVAQDDGEAIRLYRLAAQQGDAEAQTNLGWIYENGRGVPQDDVEAIHWYRLAAEQGDARAQTNLGWMYGNGRGVPQDDVAAVRWYSLAAEQGRVLAQTNLGRMYEDGEGVPQDDVEAVRWYRLAAEQGDAGAQTNLGWMYENGRGVPQDDVEAVEWYRLAAEQGDDRAQANLERMVEQGRGAP